MVAAALEAMTYGTVFVLLPELQDAHDLPTWGLGAIGGATFAATAVAQVGVSRYADRGHARLLIRAGLLLAAVGLLWFAVSTELWQFVAARAVIGLGSGAFLPAARRVLVGEDTVRAGEILGRLASIEVAGFVVGPPVAAAVFAVAGLRAPFVLQAVLLVACLPAVSSIAEPPTLEQSPTGGVVRTLLRNRGVQSALVLTAGFQVAVGMFEGTWARFLRDSGASTAMVAATLATFPIPMILLAPRAGRLVDRRGPFTVGPAALAVLVPAFVVYGVADAMALLVAAAVLQGLVCAVLIPAGQAGVARSSPPSLIASGQGLLGAIGAAVAGLGALLGAAAYGAMGAGPTWLVAAAVLLLLAVLSARIAARAGLAGPLRLRSQPVGRREHTERGT
jgi:MFS family permease